MKSLQVLHMFWFSRRQIAFANVVSDYYSATMTENPATIMEKARETADQLNSFVNANIIASYSPVTNVSVEFDGDHVNGYFFSSFPEQVRREED